MSINVAETPLAQPLQYTDASRRVGVSARPEPLGKDFARGLNEPAVKVELSDTAKEVQNAQSRRAAALEEANAENLSRADQDRPRDAQTNAPGAQEQRRTAETRAEAIGNNAKAKPPSVDLQPEDSILASTDSGLRNKIEAQDTDTPRFEPLQKPLNEKVQRGDDGLSGEKSKSTAASAADKRPVEQREITPLATQRLEQAPKVLSSGILSADAENAYKNAAALA